MDEDPSAETKTPQRSRSRLYGYSGCCCIVTVIVVVCCVLLLAAAAYYYFLWRQRSYVTVTLEVPATSLSSDLGQGLKCDLADSLTYAQPPIQFGDIFIDSFSLMDQPASAQDIGIAPTDVR